MALSIPGMAGLVTVIAVLGVTPYISLQLKAISTTFNVLRGYIRRGGVFAETA